MGQSEDWRKIAEAHVEAAKREAVSHVEWKDGDGQRVVIHDGRISIYGEPSMRRDDGHVAIGADVPAHLVLTVGAKPVEHTPRGRSEE